MIGSLVIHYEASLNMGALSVLVTQILYLLSCKWDLQF